MSNTAKATVEFEGFIAEVKGGCELSRVAEIRKQANTCMDLMNYSPDSCWQRQDFLHLNDLVTQTFVACNEREEHTQEEQR